jgi:hypothetical protein
VLAHCNNSSQIDMLPHSDTLSRFRAIQSLLFLLNAACLAKKQDIPNCYSLWFDPIRSFHDLPHSRRSHQPLHHRCGSLEAITLTITPLMWFTRGHHTNHYTTDVVHMRFGEMQYNNKCSSVTFVFHNSFEWYFSLFTYIHILSS